MVLLEALSVTTASHEVHFLKSSEPQIKAPCASARPQSLRDFPPPGAERCHPILQWPYLASASGARLRTGEPPSPYPGGRQLAIWGRSWPPALALQPAPALELAGLSPALGGRSTGRRQARRVSS